MVALFIRSFVICLFIFLSSIVVAVTDSQAGFSTYQYGYPRNINSNIHEKDFTLFESGQVRPLALSKNGRLLYALNTPDNRLEIFRLKHHRGQPKLKHLSSVFVGLEPVSLAVHHQEVWVVNHLSDSVSIVDVRRPKYPFVKQTLLVGDEPRDILFAGPKKDKAFITTAHRGQNIPFDPQLTTPGVGRADVWVFDTAVVLPKVLTRI